MGKCGVGGVGGGSIGDEDPGGQYKHSMCTNFTDAPRINNIKHFIVQPMHTNYKILRLLK